MTKSDGLPRPLQDAAKTKMAKRVSTGDKIQLSLKVVFRVQRATTVPAPSAGENTDHGEKIRLVLIPDNCGMSTCPHNCACDGAVFRGLDGQPVELEVDPMRRVSWWGNLPEMRKNIESLKQRLELLDPTGAEPTVYPQSSAHFPTQSEG